MGRAIFPQSRRTRALSTSYCGGMRIVYDTPDQLVLRHRPLLFSSALVLATLFLTYAGLDNAAHGNTGDALMCFAVVVGLLGPGLWYAIERVDVIFDATRKRCTIQKRRMSGNHSEEHALTSITRAMVQTHKGSSGDGDTHRVALVIGADKLENRHGLTRSFASGRQAAQAVERINSWLSVHRS